ncbi:MAG TPA: response regulator [Acidimicrobiia bacterium]|nr:response regulator [Acidimicrobiia bacterium]
MQRRHPGLGHPGFSKPVLSRPVRTGLRDRLRILVVDRDEDRRDLTCVSVSVLGHRAEEAWDTRGALAALATEAFDVVIVDDQIPGFDPLEVTEFILAATRRMRRRPAVVVVSTDLDVTRRTALFRAGVLEVVSRPLSLAPLYGLLTRIDRSG